MKAPCRTRVETRMSDPVRVMIERGKKKTVASAFDWPGWDRSATSEEKALAALAAYRPRFATVAGLAGLSNEFGSTGALKVVERLDGRHDRLLRCVREAGAP